MATVEFIRFNASDNVELQGWLTNAQSNIATIHIHGMSGNGYENNFLDYLREAYSKNNISFFTIDTRGRGIISDFIQNDGFKHAGSCFEIFDESIYDITGAIDYLKSIGKTKFILQGHSLGCTKVVNYVVTQDTADIEKVILLAPTDMVGWSNTDSNHPQYLEKAKQLITQDKNEELVSSQCWLDSTPISAQTYLSICGPGSSADIYGLKTDQADLGRVNIPMQIIYGTEDIGIMKIDGSIDNWLDRVNKIQNANTQINIIDGAQHSFRGYEEILSTLINNFVTK